MPSKSDQLVEFVRGRGTVSASEAVDAGFSRTLLYWLRDKGVLVQIDRGLFSHPEAEVGGDHTFLEAQKRVPESILCLLSATVFHGIGTENPRAIWLALPRGSQRPYSFHLPLHFVWFSGPALTEGIKEHERRGGILRVYSAAKTVADLFKYRKKIGTSVAVEALNDGWQQRKFTVEELIHFGKVCRVERVMKPYLESLITG